ncbi:hypothetical protein VIGAN_02158800 [Vigna angularis var. angularis]|uniref:Uncharacterized protein n=1 Tax=Vigna angularis var. angularis TaxID=157739 RepID=A0A0S3RE46_PHAAN|nr:hypothetical protein VIGAN_02158800 [Vigna angularis var. angularis]
MFNCHSDFALILCDVLALGNFEYDLGILHFSSLAYPFHSLPLHLILSLSFFSLLSIHFKPFPPTNHSLETCEM